VIPNLEAIYPETVSKLVNFAEDLDDITDFLDHSFTEQLAGSELKGQFLRSLPRGIAFHVIATFIKRQAGPIQISRSMLERIWRHLKGEHGQIKDWSEDLIGSNRIRIKGDRLRVESQKRSFNQRVAQHRKNILRHVTSMWLERGALAQVDLSELRKNSYDGDPTEKT
jgi:hypothetical protein